MPSPIQRNIGSHIYRNYPSLEFLGQVWRLDIDDLPEGSAYNLPRPIRRFLASYKPETLRQRDISCGHPPSKLAVAAARFAWEKLKDEAFGLLEDAVGRWECVDGYTEDDGEKWQKVLCIVHIRKEGSLISELYTDESECHREISNDEVKFAEQLMNLLCSNLRSWVTGILIQGSEASFWYADRMGIIVSSRFSCIEQPNLLYLAGLAIRSSTRKGLGVSSFLSFTTSTGDSEEETKIDFQNARIELPSPTWGSGEPVTETSALCFGQSNWAYPDVAPGQLVGRGTVVIPVRAMCAESRRRFHAGRTSVLKFAWANSTFSVEDATVRLIRTRLRETRPKMLVHVTELRASLTKSMEEMGLPRASMLVMEEARVLRVQLLERYSPLQLVKSAEDFKTCFLDVVNAHHWVYETSGILHGDISSDNIMMRTIDRKQRGVLVDWDLSKKPVPRSQRPRMRLGTIPFLSADFNAKWWLGEHYYRHDLEAFMNLLAWFCACFVPSTEAFNTDHVSQWYEDWESGDGSSRRFLTENFDSVMAHADPAYRALAEEWVKPLSKYFADVTGNKYSQLNMLHRLNRGERWGSWKKFNYSPKLFLDETEKIMRERDEAIDFRGFMACLGQ